LAVKLAKNTKRITNRVVQKYQLKKGLANNRIFVSAGRKDQMWLFDKYFCGDIFYFCFEIVEWIL